MLVITEKQFADTVYLVGESSSQVIDSTDKIYISMKLSHYNLENSIDFDESAVWSLVCESPRRFARLTRDFTRRRKTQTEVGFYTTANVWIYLST